MMYALHEKGTEVTSSTMSSHLFSFQSELVLLQLLNCALEPAADLVAKRPPHHTSVTHLCFTNAISTPESEANTRFAAAQLPNALSGRSLVP